MQSSMLAITDRVPRRSPGRILHAFVVKLDFSAFQTWSTAFPWTKCFFVILAISQWEAKSQTTAAPLPQPGPRLPGSTLSTSPQRRRHGWSARWEWSVKQKGQGCGLGKRGFTRPREKLSGSWTATNLSFASVGTSCNVGSVWPISLTFWPDTLSAHHCLTCGGFDELQVSNCSAMVCFTSSSFSSKLGIFRGPPLRA